MSFEEIISRDPKLTPELKRKHWGEGPWVEEEDFQEAKINGYDCIIRRIAVWDGHDLDHLFGGHLCGYVKIPEDHPFFQYTWDQWSELDIDVHGGITFCQNGWIGFDCAHTNDVTPSLLKSKSEWLEDVFPSLSSFPDPTYKDLEFVKGELKDLTMQLKGHPKPRKKDEF